MGLLPARARVRAGLSRAEHRHLPDLELLRRHHGAARFAAANRDPAQFPEPDRFDVSRANAAEHLAFGMGIHHCLGAALARKEMNVAFRTLLDRLDGFALDTSAPAPRHKQSILLWGFDSLPITFRRRSS